MSRLIRFRAWDDKSNTMHLSPVETWHLGGWLDAHRWGLETGDTHLMQFTGLLDKNGREIWEGDIVENNDLKFLVHWKESGFFLRNEKGQEFIMLSEHPHSEVIGNVWENPDLLDV